jgi:hypothetical protein
VLKREDGERERKAGEPPSGGRREMGTLRIVCPTSKERIERSDSLDEWLAGGVRRLLSRELGEGVPAAEKDDEGWWSLCRSSSFRALS